MVGGDRIAQHGQRTGADNRADGPRLEPERGKKRGLLNIGRSRIPVVQGAGGAGDVVPQGIVGTQVGVQTAIGVRLTGGLDESLDFRGTGPQIAQVDRLAVRAGAQRLGVQVDIDPTGQGEGHDQGRAHEKIGLDVLMHPRLEVPVAAQHAGGDQVMAGHRRLNVGVERARVADAGGAAVADQVKAELIQIGLEPGLVQILGHDPRPRTQRRFDRGANRQTLFNRFLGDQAGRQHDARV